MFTGIITSTATILSSPLGQSGGRLKIKLKKKLTNIKRGESIAVNGCCLTVVAYQGSTLEFDVSDETMRKTALGSLKKRILVSLERAMTAHGSFSGHFVLGHVDGVGIVMGVLREKGSVKLTISFPQEFSKLLIEKGSVAIDGISLTVCDLTQNSFSVYIIPHTFKETHLLQYGSGTRVNLEFDVIGKYVARYLGQTKALVL